MDALRFYVIDIAGSPEEYDIGTVGPMSSDDTRLRVHNDHDLFKAEEVLISVSGPDQLQLWLSTDALTWVSAVNVGDIPPGGASETFFLRRVTPVDSALGERSALLVAQADSWTEPVDTSASDNIAMTED